MKKLITVCIILEISILFLISSCGPSSKPYHTGGSEVWGKVVDTSGVPVLDAEIALTRLVDSSSVDTVAISVTNNSGEYLFKDVPAGTYLIQGEQNTRNLQFLRTDVIYDSGKVELGIDIMKVPGSVVCILNGAKKDLTGAVGFIPGTPYFNFVDQDSLIITDIYPGKYTLKVGLTPFGYLPPVIDTFLITSQQTTVIQCNLETDTSGAPPSPENLSLQSYDTLTGIATLTWEPSVVGDLEGYHVYYSLDSTNLDSKLFLIKDTVCTFAVTTRAGDSVVTYVLVKAVDKRTEESSPSNILKIVAPSPDLVITALSDQLVKPHDRLYSGDTVSVIATFENKTRAIDSITWAVVTADSVVQTARYENSYSGRDTLELIWGNFNELMVYISVYDNSGNVQKSEKKISRSGLFPPNSWKAFPAQLPTPRQYLTCVLLGNSIVTLGGEGSYFDLVVGVDRLKIYGVIESFSPFTATSGSLGTMAIPRSEHASVVYNNKIYSIGGNTSTKDSVSTIEMFDPDLGVSSIVLALPEKITGAALCVVDSKLFIIGGKRSTGNVRDGVITGSVDVVDLSKPVDAAYSHMDSLIQPRSNHCAVVCSSKIFILGGIDSTRSRTLSSVEILDINTGVISQGASMLSSRCKFSAASVNGKVYVFGGYVSKNMAITDVEVLDAPLVTSHWTKVSDMNKARYGTSAVVHNDVVYVIGGATVSSSGAAIFSSTIEEFYP